MSYLPDLAALLTSGTRIVGDGVEYVIEDQVVGVVRAPSGQIVGCNPLTDAYESPPFLVTVAPGAYPLCAWTASGDRLRPGPSIDNPEQQLAVWGQPVHVR